MSDLDHYITFAEYPLDEVLPILCPPSAMATNDDGRVVLRRGKKKVEFKTPDGTVFEVKVNSLRLQTFKEKGIACASCGARATVFRLQVDRKAGPARQAQPHLNLWGVSETGEPLLFTKDHIVAKANGGRNVLANMQTMCRPCNSKKGCS